MSMYPKYKVNGLSFNKGEDAEMFARSLALDTGKPVYVMEKLDDMTPWHVCCTVTNE